MGVVHGSGFVVPLEGPVRGLLVDNGVDIVRVGGDDQVSDDCQILVDSYAVGGDRGQHRVVRAGDLVLPAGEFIMVAVGVLRNGLDHADGADIELELVVCVDAEGLAR